MKMVLPPRLDSVESARPAPDLQLFQLENPVSRVRVIIWSVSHEADYAVLLNPRTLVLRSCTFFSLWLQVWFQSISNGGMKSLKQASTRSATHFCPWWAKGFS